MPPVRIGTVDLPERIERSHYFNELSYLELSALFTGPLKAAALARWKEIAPAQALGLVAPWVLTQRKPPKADRLWHHDDAVGDFRDSVLGRSALGAFHAVVTAVTASHAIFKSPPLDTGEAFSYTFNEAGTFEYYCSMHPRMTGKIVVK